MKEQSFNFDKFVEDLEQREKATRELRAKLNSKEALSDTRTYHRLYREHPLNRTFVSKKK